MLLRQERKSVKACFCARSAKEKSRGLSAAEEENRVPGGGASGASRRRAGCDAFARTQKRKGMLLRQERKSEEPRPVGRGGRKPRAGGGAAYRVLPALRAVAQDVTLSGVLDAFPDVVPDQAAVDLANAEGVTARGLESKEPGQLRVAG